MTSRINNWYIHVLGCGWLWYIPANEPTFYVYLRKLWWSSTSKVVCRFESVQFFVLYFYRKIFLKSDGNIDFLQSYCNAARTMDIVMLKGNIRTQNTNSPHPKLHWTRRVSQCQHRLHVLMVVSRATRCLRTCQKFWAQLLMKPFYPWFLWTLPWFWGLLPAPCWGTPLNITRHPIGDHHTALNCVVLHIIKDI